MIKTEDLINLRLLSHPFNWVIVWLVLAMAGFAAAMVTQHFQAANAAAFAQPD